MRIQYVRPYYYNHIISVSLYTREGKDLWSLYMTGTQFKEYKLLTAFCVKTKSYAIHEYLQGQIILLSQRNSFLWTNLV